MRSEMSWMKLAFLIAVMTVIGTVHAQNMAWIEGVVLNNKGLAVEGAGVQVSGINPVYTSSNGKFIIKVPAGKKLIISVSSMGFHGVTKSVPALKPGERKKMDFVLEKMDYIIDTTTIVGTIDRPNETPLGMSYMEPKTFEALPTIGSGIEQMLPFLGAQSNSELGSQYSVRGGNFDENLIYVNDIEIYRPFLVRSGQQEGLSFINPSLVDYVEFSTGGFQAKFGDKMSSVLNIRYKEPNDTNMHGSFSASLLGGQIHVEDASNNYRFTQIHGIRFRTNQYVLGALETQGAYRPYFLDYQTFLTYDINDEWEIQFLGNIAQNNYRFLPETRQTNFGTFNQALRFTVYFEGEENNTYSTYLGALALDHNRYDEKLNLKFIASAFNTVERESFDILGQYRLDELKEDIGGDDFGDVAFNRGVGSYLHHARNRLDAIVLNLQHKGSFNPRPKRKELVLETKWGARFQYENIWDTYKEWLLLDSAGYTLPRFPDSIGYQDPSAQPNYPLEMDNLVNKENLVISTRTMGYLQQNLRLLTDSSHLWDFNAGVRFNYWDFNNQLLVSPRAGISFIPNWKAKWTFRVASGFYQQPAFYREMRDLNGNINPNIQAQQSIHYIVGADYEFKAFHKVDSLKRRFKLTFELFYKDLNRLIPYEIDNVRLRYYATNNSQGEAYGMDFRLNGDFVPGAESYLSMTVMKVQEDLLDDFFYYYANDNGELITPTTIDQTPVDSFRFLPGNIPRPTDQRFSAALFFQDYIPKNENFKMHLNLVYGSGLPTGPPSYNRYEDKFRIPPYWRVDIGFSALLFDKDRGKTKTGLWKHVDKIWTSLEVFNLLQRNNVISYVWIKDTSNYYWGIPNYLTARRFNFRLQVKF